MPRRFLLQLTNESRLVSGLGLETLDGRRDLGGRDRERAAGTGGNIAESIERIECAAATDESDAAATFEALPRGNANHPNHRRARDMRPSAGREVIIGDVDQTQLPGARGLLAERE